MLKKYQSIVKVIFILFLIVVFSTGCSRDNEPDNNKIIVNGKIEIPELMEANYTEHLNIDNKQDAILETTFFNNDLNTVPLETAHLNQEEYIIKFKENIDKDYLQNSILKDKGKVINQISEDMYKIKLADDNNKLRNNLQENSSISYIEPEYLVHIQSIPNDPAYKQQWNLSMLGLEKTWENLKGSKDITIAVIDTGILADHPDLKGNIVRGYDFIDHDNDPTDSDPDFSHGTHVAGIIGAVSNNNTGISAVNWNVNIMPIRVIGADGSGGYSTLIAGIHWAVDNGADVINLSLAGSVDSKSLRDAVKYAVNNDVTIVAAAGNNGSSPILYPAQYPEVISVGAIGPTKNRAYYSNFGPELDIVAPGGDDSIISHNYNTILSTAGYMSNNTPVHQYTWAQGTSMAAPHVSGLVGLLYSTGIDNPEEIKNILKRTADDLGTEGRDDYYGAGLVNINKALGYSGENGGNQNNQDQNSNIESDIKILATNNNNGQQLATYADKKTMSFSIALTRGEWTLNAHYDDYSGQQLISVPGNNNIVIQLN